MALLRKLYNFQCGNFIYFLCLGITEYSNTSPPTQGFYENYLNNTCIGNCLWMLEISQSNQLILFVSFTLPTLSPTQRRLTQGYLLLANTLKQASVQREALDLWQTMQICPWVNRVLGTWEWFPFNFRSSSSSQATGGALSGWGREKVWHCWEGTEQCLR